MLAFRRKRRLARDEWTSSQRQGKYNDGIVHMYTDSTDELDGLENIPEEGPTNRNCNGPMLAPRNFVAAASTSGGDPLAPLSREVSTCKNCARKFHTELLTKHHEICHAVEKHVKTREIIIDLCSPPRKQNPHSERCSNENAPDRDIMDCATRKRKKASPMQNSDSPLETQSSTLPSEINSNNGRAVLVTCKHCGRNFEKDRLKKHQEICQKANRQTRLTVESTKERMKSVEHEKIDLCSPPRKQNPHSERRSHENAPDRDIMDCATRKRKKTSPMQNSDSLLKTQTSTLPSEINSNKGRAVLVTCKHCGKNFEKDRFKKHQEICQKANRQTRLTVESTKETMKSVEYEKVHEIETSEKMVEKPSIFPDSRNIEKHVKTREIIIDLCSPPRNQNPHSERCSNENAPDRDIMVCATRKRKKALPMQNSDSLLKTQSSTLPREINSNNGRAVLVTCKHCGKNFEKDRLKKHQEICQKANRQTRLTVESTKETMKSVEYEKVHEIETSEKMVEKPSIFPDSRNIEKHVKTSEIIIDLCSPPRKQNPHSERCSNENAPDRDIMDCATRKRKKTSPMQNSDSPLETQSSTLPSEINSNKGRAVLVTCKHCGRNFEKDRLKKHQEICQKISRLTTRIVENIKETMKSVEHEKVHKIAHHHKQATTKEGGEKTGSFLSSQNVEKHVKTREIIIDLCSPPRKQNPHSERRSNENAPDRDIMICATRMQEEPPPVYSTVYIKCAYCERVFNHNDVEWHGEVCAGEKSKEQSAKQNPDCEQLKLCTKQNRKKPTFKRRASI